MEKHETVPQLFKCRFCDKSFRRKDILRRHEQIMHRSYQIDFTAAGQASTDSLKCKMCSQDFGDNKESFFAHLSAKACQRKTNSFKLDKEHRFECNVCTKKYLDRDSLVKHIRWKPRDKEEFYCNICAVLNSNISRRWSDIQKKFMALIDVSVDKHVNIDRCMT